MKDTLCHFISRLAALAAFALGVCSASAANPVFPGWYADPEGVIFGKEYWIYPTYSAP